MIEFEKPNIECLEVDDNNNYAKFVPLTISCVVGFCKTL